MIVPKKDRKIIYSYLFQEGVICAKKDFMGQKKLETQGSDAEPNVVRNLFVIKLMTSLKSRGYVRETFSWQWYYWYLTNEGIEYLREYLHLPPEIVPDTLRKPAAKPARPASAVVTPSGAAAAASAGTSPASAVVAACV